MDDKMNSSEEFETEYQFGREERQAQEEQLIKQEAALRAEEERIRQETARQHHTDLKERKFSKAVFGLSSAMSIGMRLNFILALVAACAFLMFDNSYERDIRMFAAGAFFVFLGAAASCWTMKVLSAAFAVVTENAEKNLME